MQTIRDVMTANPLTLSSDTSVEEAARAMRDQGIGDVLITDGGSLKGILTDRDIAVRAVAEGMDTTSCTAGEICTLELTTVSPDTPVAEAVEAMREQSIRRLPVLEDGTVVGVVSIGDLAMERDESSALADISAAPPNN